MKKNGTLTFFCGKMGAGKTTASIKRAEEENAVLISEDVWLARLYPEQIASFEDYLQYSRRIKPLVKDLVQEILCTGTNVVMDFPANTKKQREWFKALVAEVDAGHEMIYLEASDEVCLEQIAKRRREQPDRAAFDTEEVFHQVTRFFEEPVEAEGLQIRRTPGREERK